MYPKKRPLKFRNESSLGTIKAQTQLKKKSKIILMRPGINIEENTGTVSNKPPIRPMGHIT